MKRLEAAEGMLARYGQENERLAAINEALVSRRAFVDSDYTSTPSLTSCKRLTCGLTSEEGQTSQYNEASRILEPPSLIPEQRCMLLHWRQNLCSPHMCSSVVSDSGSRNIEKSEGTGVKPCRCYG